MGDSDGSNRVAALQQMLFDNIHELKSPLVSIRGFTEILIERAADRLSDDERSYLQRILKNVDRLSDSLERVRREGMRIADGEDHGQAKK